MRSLKLPHILALSVGWLATSPAFATQISGVTCNADADGVNSIIYGHFGPTNTSSTPHFVHCGGSKGFNLTSNTLFFTGYDRSIAADFSCSAALTDAAGNPQFVGFADTGTNWFSSPAITLPIYLPQYGGLIEMDCSIPGVENGNYSYLTSYQTP